MIQVTIWNVQQVAYFVEIAKNISLNANAKMSNPRCIECGRFISYESMQKEEVIQGIDRAWDGEPIQEYYVHKKCDNKE